MPTTRPHPATEPFAHIADVLDAGHDLGDQRLAGGPGREVRVEGLCNRFPVVQQQDLQRLQLSQSFLQRGHRVGRVGLPLAGEQLIELPKRGVTGKIGGGLVRHVGVLRTRLDDGRFPPAWRATIPNDMRECEDR